MSDFTNLFAIADEIDQRVDAYRLALPNKVFELDQIAEASKQFRAHAERLQSQTIQSASTEDLMKVHTLMGETIGMIRLFHVDDTGPVQ